MGSPWKMFTQAQGQELINNTNSTWATINGVNGRKFASKTNSTKYIFLPAGGVWKDTTHKYKSINGYYLNNKYGDSSSAGIIAFSLSSISGQLVFTNSYWGHTVRAK